MGRKRIILAVLSLIGVAALVPARWVESLPLCMFHQLSGWDCPGCGLTRAFIAMAHGQWWQAIRLNALAPVIALYLALYAAQGLYSLQWGRRPKWSTPQGTRLITGLFGVLTFGQWFYKSGVHFYHLYFN